LGCAAEGSDAGDGPGVDVLALLGVAVGAVMSLVYVVPAAPAGGE
jgi:hypothetical protein